jgi:hypothetical protein
MDTHSADRLPSSSYPRLLRRNQFLLGQCAVELGGWVSRPFGRFWVSSHPDLNVETASANGRELLLIGYLLDPFRPDLSNRDILNHLLSGSDQDTIIDEAGRYSGRWILVLALGRNTLMFHDAAGSRQIVYSEPTSSEPRWFASQVDLITERSSYALDKQAEDFIHFFSSYNQEYWWPGTSTPFAAIKRLLPNHSIDLDTGKVSRYWPRAGFSPLSPRDAIERLIPLFKGSIAAAANRFDLALGVSAGWDSRLLLSACHDVVDKVAFYTAKKSHLPGTHPDIVIPKKMFKRFGIEHHQIVSDTVSDEAFIDLYNKHTHFPHRYRMSSMYECLHYFQLTKVAMTGNVSEIARCFYRPAARGKKDVNGSMLSETVNMRMHPFSVKEFQNYLDNVGDRHDYQLLDLFYWEQRIGSWFAGNILEFEIAWKELFFPFNNRLLLETFLRVDERLRSEPEYELYRLLIHAMWQELLEYPINPPQRDLQHLVTSSMRTLRKWKRRFLGRDAEAGRPTN